MKKIRTIGEIEAITRFMYENDRSYLLDYNCTLIPYDEMKETYRSAYQHAVKALLNHLEIVEELELKK